MPSLHVETYRFGQFELDISAGELRRNTRRVRLQPQPFKLLVLLARRAGSLVPREDIRSELWPDGTFVDFDQSVNFSIRQIRDVLGDSAESPLYIETVPRRGYRFIAPVETAAPENAAAVVAPTSVPASDAPMPPGTTTVRLQKALWTNIAELRVAEERRRRITYISILIVGLAVAALATYLILTRN